MAETPQLYGPRVLVIVLKTSNCCTREPDNSYRINMELPQHYNIWYKNNLDRSAEDL